MAVSMRNAAVGRYVLGLGLAFMGALSLVWADFVTGQSAPTGPYHAVMAELAGAFMVLGGAGLAWRRTASAAALAVAGYFGLVVAVVMNGADTLAHRTVYGVYEIAAEQFAIASAALLVFVEAARVEAGLATRLKRSAQVVFGLCALVFGGAHFAYMNLTVPLVPKWLPPSQVFWAYATGVSHVAAGLAIASGIRARLAAILLTVMYAAFQPLVHLPMLLASPASHFEWGENAINLALVGAAWVVADSFRDREIPPAVNPVP
jgi:uncharacterized membrane protein